MSNKQNELKAHFNQIFNKHFGRITTEAAKKLRSDCIDELLALHKASTNKAVREARIKEFQLGLQTGAMPEFIGKPFAEEHLAELEAHLNQGE